MTRARRGKQKQSKCPKCKKQARDHYAGKDDTCTKCKHDLKYGEPILKCSGKCKWLLCIFCKSGEKRPAPAQESSSESDEDDGLSDAVLIPAKITGVPKKKAKETPREIEAREAAVVKQLEKQRILDAQTRGLPPICDITQTYPKPPNDAYPLCQKGRGFRAGGQEVPLFAHPAENKNGFVLYQALDFTAEHPSGLRKFFRRGQRIWANDECYPSGYKPIANDWSLIVLHLAVEVKGGKVVGWPRIHAAPWRHINKDRCKVKRFVLDLGPEDVKESELHICPLIEEDTHNVKFTNVTHSDYMAFKLARIAEIVEQEAEPEPEPEPELEPAEEEAEPAMEDAVGGSKRKHTLSASIVKAPSIEEAKAAAEAKKQRLSYKNSDTFAMNM